MFIFKMFTFKFWRHSWDLCYWEPCLFGHIRDSVNLQTLIITVMFTNKGKILFYDKVCRSANNIMKNNNHMSCMLSGL